MKKNYIIKIFLNTLIIFGILIISIQTKSAFSKESNALFFPLGGKSGDTVQVSIHLDADFSQRVDPVFYGRGTVLGADLISSQKGTVTMEYDFVKAIQVYSKRLKVKKISMAAVPKKIISFGKGSEIIKLFFKVSEANSAYFILSTFNFGNRLFGKNYILKQPIVCRIPVGIEKYQYTALSHKLWMIKKYTLITSKM